MMDSPDVKGRRQILDVHVKGKPLATDIDLDIIAKETHGFVGADIENLVNESAILAARPQPAIQLDKMNSKKLLTAS